MTWKCIACSYENCNTLSSECSICGMERSAETAPDTSSTWQDSASTLDCASVNSFGGNDSNNSLSLNNSFSIHEDELLMEDQRISNSNKRSFHASLPAAANFNTSFSSIRSTRSTRSAYGNRPRRSANQTRRSQQEPDLNSSVMSFCDWNPNEKLQSWNCQQCTFVNENPLHLVCEMCGHRRKQPEAQPEQNETASAGEQQREETQELDEEGEIRLIQEEQMRELIDVQRDLMSNFGRPQPSSPAGRFDTRDMQRELNQVQTVTPPTVRRPSPLSFLESSSDEEDNDEQGKIEDILATTKELLMDFKRQRTADESVARLDTKPAPSLVSPTLGGSAYKSTLNESGRNAPNVTPKSATTCLKYSMKSTGGKLTYNDLCLPLLWGDDLDDLKKPKAKKTPNTTSP